MRILIIGQGGREHSLCHILTNQGNHVFCFPGNAGTKKISEPYPENLQTMDFYEFSKIIEFVKNEKIDFTICCLENMLEKGIADYFYLEGHKFFGPTKFASQIETSKFWAKDFMRKYGIPTACHVKYDESSEARTGVINYFHEWNGVVIKPNGLTEGKGVAVCRSIKEVENAIQTLMLDKAYDGAGETILIEEILEGQEISIIAFSDGKKIIPMIPVQDHKRLYDGNQGPNTGGIGAYSPLPFLENNTLTKINELIIEKTNQGLLKEGINYKGFIHFGIIITQEGPKLLEYNCRLGDPEAQVIFPLLKSNLAEVIYACLEGDFKGQLEWKELSACSVMMISRGYPKTFQTGFHITGIQEAEKCPHTFIFHAGTDLNSLGEVITSDGRVLTVTALGNSLEEAISRCYSSLSKIDFQGVYYRLDIAANAWTKI